METVPFKDAKLIGEKDIADLKEQLAAMNRDKDRVRLVRAAAGSHRFMSSNIIELVEVQHFGSAVVETVVLLYPRLEDQDNFDKVLAALPYDEDRADVKKALHLN